MADLHRDATELGIEIIAAESFVDSPGVSIENIKVGLASTGSSDIKPFVL